GAALPGTEREVQGVRGGGGGRLERADADGGGGDHAEDEARDERRQGGGIDHGGRHRSRRARGGAGPAVQAPVAEDRAASRGRAVGTNLTPGPREPHRGLRP